MGSAKFGDLSTKKGTTIISDFKTIKEYQNDYSF
jgi:hypothetical protein